MFSRFCHLLSGITSDCQIQCHKTSTKPRQSKDKGKSVNLLHLSGPIYGLVSQKALLHIINFLVSKKQMFASNEDSGCPHIDKEKDTRAT